MNVWSPELAPSFTSVNELICLKKDAWEEVRITLLMKKKEGPQRKPFPRLSGSRLPCSESVHNCLSASFSLPRGEKHGIMWSAPRCVTGYSLCEAPERGDAADVQQEGRTNPSRLKAWAQLSVSTRADKPTQRTAPLPSNHCSSLVQGQ